MKKTLKKLVVILMAVTLVIATCAPSMAATAKSTYTKIKKTVKTTGECSTSYALSNWEGVSNVSEFVDNKGNYCFAYPEGKKIIVVKTKNGKVKKKISLVKKGANVGGIACDKDGNYFVVTGKHNKSQNVYLNTVFISKYNSNGKFIKTIGDTGDSSLIIARFDYTWCTLNAFFGGNCDIAVNGDVVAVNYAREMYSGHQSNCVLAINRNTMEQVDYSEIYNSHSFGQRTLAFGDGFIFASEGDCYPRAISITQTDATSKLKKADIFHFWVQKNAQSDGNMGVLNKNFAHIGDILNIDNKYVANVGTSVKSLSSKAKKETENIYIQIFDPSKDMTTADAYVTSGKRSGLGGGNGTDSVTDYGVKWITSGSKYTYEYPQAAYDGKGHIIVLFEQYYKGVYKGVYYYVLNKSGKVLGSKRCYSKTAKLNHCETPRVANHTVYWTGNKVNSNKMYVFSLKI